jgi:hypothetical protein
LKSSSLPSFTLCVPIKINGSAITMPPFPRSRRSVLRPL